MIQLTVTSFNGAQEQPGPACAAGEPAARPTASPHAATNAARTRRAAKHRIDFICYPHSKIAGQPQAGRPAYGRISTSSWLGRA